MTAELTKPIFTDETKAREYLEAVRWPNGPICPHCGATDNITRLEGESHRAGLHQCNHCREHFTVTVGTVYERSHVPLHKWLLATHLMCASKKGISSKQLERMLGVTYKTAWFMSHRIRESMNLGYGGPLGSDGGPVEVDETYWGNKGKQRKGASGYDHKMKIISLVDRKGEKRSFHIANVTTKTVTPILKKHISEKARLMTDQAGYYLHPGKHFASHETVNHAKHEYARGDVTTNTGESSFAIFKRGLYGIFHHVSEAHLQRYATEFDFKWNHREKLGYSDADRTLAALKGISGKRLTYRRTNAQ